MNQILETNLESKSKSHKKNKILKFQFYLSLLLIVILSIYIGYTKIKLNNQEKYSKSILQNYGITKLYSNYLEDNVPNLYENSSIIGIIEIKKINLYYPIFSTYNDELLKIAPCRFYGPFPGELGNLCIIGHNYDNNKFFSQISSLEINDEILIYNNLNKTFSYYVTDIYEIDSTDFSPIYLFDKTKTQLTLITCNNLNKKRIIVKAFEKEA